MSVIVRLAEQITDMLNASDASWETKLNALSVASVLLSEERTAARAAAAEEGELDVPAADSLQSPEDDR